MAGPAIGELARDIPGAAEFSAAPNGRTTNGSEPRMNVGQSPAAGRSENFPGFLIGTDVDPVKASRTPSPIRVQPSGTPQGSENDVLFKKVLAIVGPKGRYPMPPTTLDQDYRGGTVTDEGVKFGVNIIPLVAGTDRYGHLVRVATEAPKEPLVVAEFTTGPGAYRSLVKSHPGEDGASSVKDAIDRFHGINGGARVENHRGKVKPEETVTSGEVEVLFEHHVATSGEAEAKSYERFLDSTDLGFVNNVVNNTSVVMEGTKPAVNELITIKERVKKRGSDEMEEKPVEVLVQVLGTDAAEKNVRGKGNNTFFLQPVDEHGKSQVDAEGNKKIVALDSENVFDNVQMLIKTGDGSKEGMRTYAVVDGEVYGIEKRQSFQRDTNENSLYYDNSLVVSDTYTFHPQPQEVAKRIAKRARMASAHHVAKQSQAKAA